MTASTAIRERTAVRDRRVLNLISVGLTNRQIARQIGVTDDTVKQIMRRLLRVYGARDRAHLMANAARVGHINPDEQAVLTAEYLPFPPAHLPGETS